MSGLETLHMLMQGALVMATSMAAVYFLRFWRASQDRLFLLFALAFVTLAVDWAALALMRTHAESHRYIFVVRLLAFVLIIAGIIDRNRRGPRS